MHDPEPLLTLVALRRHLPLRMTLAAPLDDEQLLELCALNRDLRIERTAEGDLVVMPPTGGETGRRNASIQRQLGNWAEADGTGVVFDSSTGFLLANGAERSPDAAWVSRERWDALTAEQKRGFPPLCPDFVVELRSPSDRLDDLHAKMREYVQSGGRLGLLIDPDARVVWRYHAGGAVDRLDAPATISADPVLPGFSLDLSRVW